MHPESRQRIAAAPAARGDRAPGAACSQSSVSVVIPTAAAGPRLATLRRAVLSALRQTAPPREIIVVADGDEELARTAREVACIDASVTVMATGGRVGAGAARNAGVRASGGEWVAFLDDDDEWCSDKLATQLGAISGYEPEAPVAAYGRMLAKRAGRADEIWPRRLYSGEEPLAEYLFCRRRLRQGDGYVQTSTLLVSRSLMLSVGFDEKLTIHQDWDWLLRVERDVPGFTLVGVPDVVSVWHLEDAGGSVSRSTGWRRSRDWAVANQTYFTPRSFSAFLLSVTLGMACRDHDSAAAGAVLRLAGCQGRHTRARDLVLAAALLARAAGTRTRSLRASRA